MILSYTAKTNDEGKTVKQIIEREFNLSSRLMSKLKNSGGINVNGENVTVRFLLHENDVLTLCKEDEPSKNVIMSDIPLQVLYEDEDLLAVNKPMGMPTHPSAGHHDDTLANAVLYRYRNEKFTFRAITRLDGDTTGVVLVARNALSAQRLTDLLVQGKIIKEYTALCEGVPMPLKGEIDAPIARCEDSIIKRKIDKDGKNALTHYEVERQSRDGKYSLVKAVPVTGRTHQIRLHLSHIGTSIYGDFLYGNPLDGVRAHLHCSCLTFCHPTSGETIKIRAPLPDDTCNLIEEFF